MSIAKVYKVFFVKLIAVFVATVLMLGLAPYSDILNFCFNASAEAVPKYDSTLGSYNEHIDSNGNTVLTATPYKGCGFRGWYLKDGTEVSYNSSYTLPLGADADDYTPVFYNFNLVKNGGFEEYENGLSLKSGVSNDEVWEGLCDSELKDSGNDWTTAKVSSARAKRGTKSLEIQSQSNTTYHDFYNLEPQTQYTLSFWYNINPSTTSVKKYLNFVSVIGADMQTTTRANSNNGDYLNAVAFNADSGACAEDEWKEVCLTFSTENNTSARLALYYISNDINNSPVSASLYIDDVVLFKDVMAESTYFNEDFANSDKRWNIFNTDLLKKSLDNGRLKVESIIPASHIQSSVFKVKKGATYNITFDLDLNEVTHQYIQETVDGELQYDADGNPVWRENENGELAPNWIDFSFSTAESKYIPYYLSESTAGTDFVWTVTDANGKIYTARYGKGASFTGFGKYTTLATAGLDTTNSLNISVSFTAHETADVYFNSRLNGLGVYYLDNFKISEDVTSVDYMSLIKDNAISSLGTAIRTVGRQGMRHKTEISKRLLTADMYYGVRLIEYGTLAIKSDYLGENELVLNGIYDYNDVTYGSKKGIAYSFEDKTDLVYADEQTTIDFTGVLINIVEENWTSNYTVRAYFKYIDLDGNISTIYIEPSDIAVYPIAKIAYSARNEDNEFSESAEVREYLYNKIITKFTDKVINIYNESEAISSNFQGIRSTVYHGVTFFPDLHGRTYTEEQAAVEIDRLVDTKVDNVRTRFDSHWMWEAGSGWNWNSTKMTAFYKWAEMLQERDISITLQAGWHLHDFIYFYDTNVATEKVGYAQATAEGHSSIPEVNYLHGYTDVPTSKATALYGEDSNASAIEAAGRNIGLNLNDEEFAHYSVAAARYAEWIKQALNTFKARGINNVEYILPFTETGYTMVGDPTYSYDEWMLMTLALNNTLENEDIRSNYKIIGPAQSIYANQGRLSLVEYIYSLINGTEYEALLDINAMHSYTKPNTNLGYADTVYEPYASYSMAEENFEYYDRILTESGTRNKEFWCDEFFATAPDAKHWDGVGMQLTQFAAGFTAGINNGVNRFLTWQMFDALWDSEATHSNAEFIGGVHSVGTCPSLIKADGDNCPSGSGCRCNNYIYSSYTPRVTYYGINLIGKYMNNKNADVFKTEVIDEATKDGGGVYVSAIKNDNGKTVILVVNTMPVVSTVNLNLEGKGFNFSRYTYNPDEIIPTVDAQSIKSDKTIFSLRASSFSDVIPARSFRLYVDENGTSSEDTEIPFE
ncbi:MAG: hypothetical protein E7551_07915 [Ruminococcaceae bacterium]|nr:hypothetical protein [Oscillospiraceae bacterium]